MFFPRKKHPSLSPSVFFDPLLAMLLDLLSIPLWTLDPLGSLGGDIKAYADPTTPPHPLPVDTLKVVTWNIKFGAGRLDFFFDGHGDITRMTRGQVLEHLAGICTLICELDPDVLFLQEVDLPSSRSGHIDQVHHILGHTPLRHGFYASHWKSRFVPKHRIGRIDSGLAILSKWPLERATSYPLPLIGSQDPLTQYFYLKRRILCAHLKLRDTCTIVLMNTHLEAFARDDTKLRQVRQLHRQARAASSLPHTLVVFGGDLNTLPPGTHLLHDFPDVAPHHAPEFEAADFRSQASWLAPLYEDFAPAIALERYLHDQPAHATHSTCAKAWWNRKLDYLFASGPWRSGHTHQGPLISGGAHPMALSDHAPVAGALILR